MGALLENYNSCREFLFNLQKTKNALDHKLNTKNTPDLFSYSVHIYEPPQIYFIDEDQKQLLYQTKNEIYPRPLPHESIFIEKKMETESLEIKGILLNYRTIVSCKFLEIYPDAFRKVLSKNEMDVLFKKFYTKYEDEVALVIPSEKMIREKKYSLEYKFWVFRKGDKKHGFFRSGSITFDYKKKKKEYEKNLDYEKYEIYNFDGDSIETLENNIVNFICNFLDFLNNPEVEIVPIRRTKEQNLKRIKRGKEPIPDYNMIRLTGELKRYMEKAQQMGAFDYSHKFWVRGHQIRFWNKDRYRFLYKKFNENKLKGYYMDEHNDVLMKWIMPYIKGEGILVNKMYSIESK